MKRILWIAFGTIVLAGLAFIGTGGQQGVALLAAKYLMRKDPAPNRAVSWEQGPARNERATDGAKRRPNVIVILADDLGFNDVTFNGGGVAGGAVPTPSIDSIGREGVSFSSGYAGNATCSPSRAAMLTGRYATRFGFEFTPIPVQFSRVVGHDAPKDSAFKPIYHGDLVSQVPDVADMGLPDTEKTMATLLKADGYHTIHIGKWHLGETRRMRPNAHGFDESLGFLSGGSMFLPESDPNVVNAKHPLDPIDKFIWAMQPSGVRFNDSEPFATKGYMTDYFTDEAVKAIQANRNRPFFMYLAYNAPHTPLQATKADYDALPQIKSHPLRVYGAMIRSLDRNIGRVLQALKAAGIDDNTLVVFTSDNGGANYIDLAEINKPFRGWKATFFEGGVRVPFYMRWPGVIPAGSDYAAPVSHFDIFATALAATGTAMPTDRVIDGVDLLPFVNRKRSGRPHDQLFWRSGHYRMMVSGDWKLQVTDHPRKDWLYNLKDDPYEKNNLAATRPETVSQLKAALAAHERSQVKPLWPALVESPIGIDKTLSQPLLASDEMIYWPI